MAFLPTPYRFRRPFGTVAACLTREERDLIRGLAACGSSELAVAILSHPKCTPMLREYVTKQKDEWVAIEQAYREFFIDLGLSLMDDNRRYRKFKRWFCLVPGRGFSSWCPSRKVFLQLQRSFSSGVAVS